MLNEGVTLGALRKLVTNTELIDLLEKVGVDTGAFGQIIKVVNALPSITDGVRVGFGVPKNQAGLYTVTVITARMLVELTLTLTLAFLTVTEPSAASEGLYSALPLKVICTLCSPAPMGA